MKLIVGLGNPGSEYEKTRHNVGFLVLDALAESWGVHFEAQKKMKSEMLVTMKDGETVILAKPQTFMNESGNAVRKLMDFYKLESSDIWVVSDDVDLDFGEIRERDSGSAGGHNGLKSVIAHIGENFNRVRVGVGSNRDAGIPSEAYVLQSFSKDQAEKLDEVTTKAVETLETVIKNPA